MSEKTNKQMPKEPLQPTFGEFKSTFNQDNSIYTYFIPFFGLNNPDLIQDFAQLWFSQNISHTQPLLYLRTNSTKQIHFYPSGIFSIIPHDNLANHKITSIKQLHIHFQQLFFPTHAINVDKQLPDRYLTNLQLTNWLTQNYFQADKLIDFSPTPIIITINGQQCVLIHHPAVHFITDCSQSRYNVNKKQTQTFLHYYSPTFLSSLSASSFRLQFIPMDLTRHQLIFKNSLHETFMKRDPKNTAPIVNDVTLLGLGAENMPSSILYINTMSDNSIHILNSFILFQIRCKNAQSTIFNTSAPVVIILQNDMNGDVDKLIDEKAIKALISTYLDLDCFIIHEGIDRSVSRTELPPPTLPTTINTYSSISQFSPHFVPIQVSSNNIDSSSDEEEDTSYNPCKVSLVQEILLIKPTQDTVDLSINLSNTLTQNILLPIIREILFGQPSEVSNLVNEFPKVNPLVHYQSPLPLYHSPQYLHLLPLSQWQDLLRLKIIPLQLTMYTFEVESFIAKSSTEYKYIGEQYHSKLLQQSLCADNHWHPITNLQLEYFVKVSHTSSLISSSNNVQNEYQTQKLPQQLPKLQELKPLFEPIQYTPIHPDNTLYNPLFDLSMLHNTPRHLEALSLPIPSSPSTHTIPESQIFESIGPEYHYDLNAKEQKHPLKIETNSGFAQSYSFFYSGPDASLLESKLPYTATLSYLRSKTVHLDQFQNTKTQALGETTDNSPIDVILDNSLKSVNSSTNTDVNTTKNSDHSLEICCSHVELEVVSSDLQQALNQVANIPLTISRRGDDLPNDQINALKTQSLSVKFPMNQILGIQQYLSNKQNTCENIENINTAEKLVQPSSHYNISILNCFRREIFAHHRFPHVEEMQTNPRLFPGISILSVYDPSCSILSSLTYDIRVIRRILHTVDVIVPIFFVTVLPINFDFNSAQLHVIDPNKDKPLLGWDFTYPHTSVSMFSSIKSFFTKPIPSKNDPSYNGLSLDQQLILQRMKHLEQICLDPELVELDQDPDINTDWVRNDESFLKHRAGVWTSPQTNSALNHLPPCEKVKLRPVYHLLVRGYEGYLDALPFINRCAIGHLFSLVTNKKSP